MLPAGFEPEIPASERPNNHALDHAAAGIGMLYITVGNPADNEQKARFIMPIKNVIKKTVA
jgi:hypothetical protein